MKVSIITPSFNSARTIQHTIDSVALQNYPNIEYIVIDGGSTDGTLEILHANDHLISYWVSEQDKGIYDAMNKGIKQATGDVIAIINSDDFYVHAEVINRVVQQFKRTKVDSIYGDLQYVAPDNTDRVIRHWASGKFQRKNFLYGWMPPHPTFFVKRKVYESFGLFDTRLKTSADYELMLRFLYKNNISSHYLDELLVRMRAGGASNQSWHNRLKANREDRRAWEINNLRPYFFTALLKPARKINQYFARYKVEVEPWRTKQMENV